MVMSGLHHFLVKLAAQRFGRPDHVVPHGAEPFDDEAVGAADLLLGPENGWVLLEREVETLGESEFARRLVTLSLDECRTGEQQGDRSGEPDVVHDLGAAFGSGKS